MARTPEGKLLTDLHRRQQMALRASVVRDVMKLWPAWQPSKPDSYQAFERAMVLLVQSRSVQSAAISARYYEMFRAADAPGRQIARTVPLAAARDEAEIRASISVTARAGVHTALGAGQTYEAAMRNGLVRVSGAASREVLNAGRDTILEEVKRDPRSQGWARVTGADACPFCAMLSSRGPAYSESGVDFEAHDHCSCGAEPVYEGSEWPGRGREFQQRWYESDRTLNGFRQSMNKTPEPA
jgi:hypothetical protein